MEINKRLDQLFNQLGEERYGRLWSQRCLESLVLKSTPFGRNEVKSYKKIDRYRAEAVKEQLLGLLKDKKTDLKIKGKNGKPVVPSKRFHFGKIYIPESCLIEVDQNGTDGEWTQCWVTIREDNPFAMKKMNTGKTDHDLEYMRGKVTEIVNNLDKITIKNVQQKLEIVCAQEGVGSPKRSWLSDNCGDIISKAKARKI